MEFQWLRTPYPERLFSLTGSALRLHGRESVGSWFEQSLVARRQEDFTFRAETASRSIRVTYQQVAGLTYYYNRFKFHFVAVTWHERTAAPHDVRAPASTRRPHDLPARPPLPVPAHGPIAFAVDVDHERLQFHFAAGQGLDEDSARCSMRA